MTTGLTRPTPTPARAYAGSPHAPTRPTPTPVWPFPLAPLPGPPLDRLPFNPDNCEDAPL